MILMQDDTSTYLSMEPYIDNACRILEIKPAKRASTPISQPIHHQKFPFETYVSNVTFQVTSQVTFQTFVSKGNV